MTGRMVTTGTMVRADTLELEHVNRALREVRGTAEAGRFVDAAADNMFIVGRAPTVDQLVDLTLGAPPPENFMFMPEMDETRVRWGIRGKYRGATVVVALNYREEPQLRVQDLDVIVAADASLVIEACRLQGAGQRADGSLDAGLNMLVHGARLAGLAYTIVDLGVLASVGGDGL